MAHEIGTPQASVLNQLNAATNKAMVDPGNLKRIEDAGVIAFPAMTRAEVEKFMRSEYDVWVPLVRATGGHARLGV